MKFFQRYLPSFSLIILAIVLEVPFGILSATFDYPDILRRPPAEILQRFSAEGPALIGIWYLFMFSALLLIPVAALLRDRFQGASASTLNLGLIFGVLAGLVQAMGLIRWVFVVPVLASRYNDPAATEAVRASVETVFLALHAYAGVALGEHLGQLLTAGWLGMISLALIQGKETERKSAPVLAGSGLLIALTMTLGLGEGFATVIPFDVGIVGLLTPVSFVALSLWLIALAIRLWPASQKTTVLMEAQA